MIKDFFSSTKVLQTKSEFYNKKEDEPMGSESNEFQKFEEFLNNSTEYDYKIETENKTFKSALNYDIFKL